MTLSDLSEVAAGHGNGRWRWNK